MFTAWDDPATLRTTQHPDICVQMDHNQLSPSPFTRIGEITWLSKRCKKRWGAKLTISGNNIERLVP